MSDEEVDELSLLISEVDMIMFEIVEGTEKDPESGYLEVTV